MERVCVRDLMREALHRGVVNLDHASLGEDLVTRLRHNRDGETNISAVDPVAALVSGALNTKQIETIIDLVQNGH